MIRVLILAAVCLFPAAEMAAASDIEWLDDLNTALTEAAKSKKPVFLHFYADWCVPCHRLERVVFRDQQWISSIRRSFVPLKVNLDAHPELARKYGITSIPADVYLTPTGEVLANERSPSNVEGYSQTIAQVSQREAKSELPPDVPGALAAKAGADSQLPGSSAPVEMGPASGSRSFFAEALGPPRSEATAARETAPIK